MQYHLRGTIDKMQLISMSCAPIDSYTRTGVVTVDGVDHGLTVGSTTNIEYVVRWSGVYFTIEELEITPVYRNTLRDGLYICYYNGSSKSVLKSISERSFDSLLISVMRIGSIEGQAVITYD